jgi:hypothetical protein
MHCLILQGRVERTLYKRLSMHYFILQGRVETTLYKRRSVFPLSSTFPLSYSVLTLSLFFL